MSKALESLKANTIRLRRETLTLYLAYRDPRTPWYARVLVAGIVAYALSPIDLIPDFVPVLGYLDDVVVIPLGIALAVRLIPAEVMADARERARVELTDNRPRSRVAAAIFVLIWVLALGAFAWASWYAWRVAHVATGFVAKTVCSGVFVSEHRCTRYVGTNDIIAQHSGDLPLTIKLAKLDLNRMVLIPGGRSSGTIFFNHHLPLR